MNFLKQAPACWLSASLLLAGGSAWAQPQAAEMAASTALPVVTLQTALAQAMAQNPGLRAAQQAVAASEGAMIQSQARPNPELAFSQEDTRRATRSSSLQWNQSIEIGGKRCAHEGGRAWRGAGPRRAGHGAGGIARRCARRVCEPAGGPAACAAQ